MPHPESDPRTKYPAPPLLEADQEAPGSDAAMHVKAAHGEKSYRGSGKLYGNTAFITGGDSGTRRVVAIAFATTKGAIVTFTKGLARMLAGKGIRINVVAPRPDLPAVDFFHSRG